MEGSKKRVHNTVGGKGMEPYLGRCGLKELRTQLRALQSLSRADPSMLSSDNFY